MDLTVNVVGESNEELSTSEAVELVVDPLLSEGIVDDALCLSCAVEGLCELVEV